MTTLHPKTPRKCPPKDAVPPNGAYFRIVLNNPPIPEDFVIWIEEPYNRHKIREKTKQGDCRAFATSMFTTEAATLRKIDMFLHAWKKRSKVYGNGFLGIAQVKLDSTSGVIKQTGADPVHYDLWPYVNSKLECNIITVREA